MKAISFFHPSTEIKYSVTLLLFFRMVGIYVVEVLTDVYSNEQNNKAIEATDVKIYLYVDENKEKTENLNGDFIILDKCVLDGKSAYDIILYLLNQFCEKRIIDKEENNDLNDALNVFRETDYKTANLLGIYYFEHCESKNIKRIYDIYIEIADKLMNVLKKNNISVWGNSHYIHCRYAFINIFYEMDLFCKKNELDYYMDMNSLIKACVHIDNKEGQYLDKRFKVLEAEIYNQLLENISDAFQLYVDSCQNSYDSYVFFCKAEIMYKKNELNRAISYYRQSVYMYPQYYRAWFKLGVCYLENKEDVDVTLDAFWHVIRILKNKANSDVLRAIEFEYYYNSFMNIADIKKQIKDYRGALLACDGALETYVSVRNCRFYSELGIDLMNNEKITMDILSHLETEKLKKDGIELSMMLDLEDHAKLYTIL